MLSQEEYEAELEAVPELAEPDLDHFTAASYFTELVRRYLYDRFGGDRVLRYDEPFNFSRLNNRAAEEASGAYLLLRRWCDGLLVKLSLLPVLLLSSFCLASLQQTAVVDQVLTATFALYFLFRILDGEEGMDPEAPIEIAIGVGDIDDFFGTFANDIPTNQAFIPDFIGTSVFAVPVPATAWFIASGLAVFASFARRRH